MPTAPIDYALNADMTAPAVDGLSITPSDGSNLTVAVRGIWCGTSGTVSIVTPRGTTLVFTVQAGSFIPFCAVKVTAANTTATGLIGAI